MLKRLKRFKSYKDSLSDDHKFVSAITYVVKVVTVGLDHDVFVQFISVSFVITVVLLVVVVTVDKIVLVLGVVPADGELCDISSISATMLYCRYIESSQPRAVLCVGGCISKEYQHLTRAPMEMIQSM